jgi:serine/threonine protein kinase
MPFDWRKYLGLRRPTSAANKKSSEKPGPVVQSSVRRGYERGESVGGEYRVLDVFEGGMGSVYLVEHHELNSPIVLKTLLAANDRNAMQAFRREAETWVDVGFHQNIVKAHFFRIIDGLPFVGAEYIAPDANGHNSVADYVGADNGESVLLRWCAQFCYGMMHACSRGVVAHRDVKPANLLVDSSGNLKVADFGLARTVGLPSGAREGSQERLRVVGTLPYMAPEQILTPDQLDHRVDIYAMGVVLYQLISGSLPYNTHSQESLVQSILKEKPAPLSGPLWPICDRCLSKDRNARFPNFDAFLSAVTGVADQLGVTIPPKSTGISEESDALFAKVLSYRELGELDLAKQRLQEFVSRFSSDYRGWTETGVMYLAMGDAQQAYDATKKSLSLYPFNSHAWNNLGIALSRLGKFADAVNALKTAVSHDPLNTGAMLNQCTPLVELKRPIEAVQVLERAASLAPDKAAIWANLGAIRMKMGELSDAEQCFEKALALHPGLPEVEANLEMLRQGINTECKVPDPAALLAKGEVRQARRLLLERVRNNPDDVDACHNLGIAALHEGKDEEAIEWFRRVTKLDPNEEFAATQLVKSHAERGEFDAALSYCDRLASIPGMMIKEASLRAQILQACGRTEEAITRLTTLVERDPNLDTIWFMLSEIYEREGLRLDALEASKQCLDVLLRFGGNRDNIDMVKQRISSLL